MTYPSVTLSLPPWIADELGDPGRRYASSDDRMRLAIRLADRNVSHGTGGPFGACVFEIESGLLVAPGVNLVVSSGCSVAHAEAMAILIAERRLGTFDLGAEGLPAMELATSARPCVQCFGVLWWSGVRRVLVGARGEDVERLAGFREGPLPVRWERRLADRAPLPPVEVVQDCRREEACAVLSRYREAGGPVYNPGSGGST